jgi:hypothetical protein
MWLALLVIPLAVVTVLWHIAARTLDDRLSDWHLPSLHALEERIEGYAEDVGHLPTALSELIESNESGWQGPYARAWTLHDVDGAEISYEVLNARTFRIVLPARHHEGHVVWPSIAEEFTLSDAVPVDR